MATGHEPPPRPQRSTPPAAEQQHRESTLPAGESATAEDVEVAERRAEEARQGAAQAALSAARSFEETARLQEEVAQIEDQTIQQGLGQSDRLQVSAQRHRHDADEDRALAQQKRREAEGGLRPDTSQ